ncbi:ABC transporter permease [Paenibacillus psychroresistens]|uniref:ABC transporter permease n=1 Tax=Paenibacillus psychroresistens TaxID=1778678 RepID=A0A6B8RIU1_9BACL|nr:ABC transporter permease [Paenibacillus psychroresistens]QGQ95492.1 ABC transporter permease [Paenibacillus psychroresistens]
MYSLVANVVNETEKQFWKKKTVFFLILSALIPLVGALLIASFQSKLGIASITAADYPILVLGLFTSFILPLFVFMAAADSFAGEASSNTLKIVLLRPISRFKIYASKHISLGIYTMLYLIAAGISSILSGLFFSVKAGMPQGILDALLAYIVAVIPFIALTCIAVLIAQFTRSGSGALIICIILYMGIKAASFFLPQVSLYSLTSYTDWHVLWLSSSVALGKLISIFMFIAACSILCFTAGFYFFDKKEV